MTENISRSVTSNQEGVHADLHKLVLRHSRSSFNRPISAHTQQAFESLEKRVAVDGRPLVFDSGCGVGESTVNLAKLHRDCLVIGLDQSLHRLSKNLYYSGEGGELDNIILLRADCVDFWRLAERAGWTLHKHFILYPNPWPKKSHLKRRWHGHPVLMSLLQLGGDLELRSNWQLYVQEFAAALELLGYEFQQGEMQADAGVYLTPFERKYALSGQPLYHLNSCLNEVA